MSLKKTDTLEIEQLQPWAYLTPLHNTQPLPKFTLSAASTLIGRNS